MRCAVILSGCGYLDGAEVFESVLTLLALSQRGVEYQCFAPDKAQMHVVNHLTGEEQAGASRNVLEESGRIVRGDVRALDTLNPEEFDALLVPGGYGVAKNLCDFAVKGRSMTVDEQMLSVCKAFADAAKPAGYLCIAPALIARVYGEGTVCSIGFDADTAAELAAMGASHKECAVDDIVVDEAKKVVPTPAHMEAQSILDAQVGITKLVNRVLDFLPA